jgi:hypothetical protein
VFRAGFGVTLNVKGRSIVLPGRREDEGLAEGPG